MNTTIGKMDDVKVKLSTLWIVAMFNMLKADILSMYIPGALEEVVEFAGNTPITQIMLGAAIIMEISIAMIFLSWVLKYRANRWANIIVGVLTIVWIWAGGATYPHYIFIATVETVCLLLIVWYAWKWPNPESQS
jgi:hypothetical protein